MKLLILGATGMLGHILWEEARTRPIDAYATIRRTPPGLEEFFPRDRVVIGVDAERYETVNAALNELHPNIVLNCIGVVKQSSEINDPIKTININSLFPHVLSRNCQKLGIRLVHMSTDCVFSGKRGLYKESDQPDPTDFYGQSKLMGEPTGESTLTIRTSMFGPELGKRQGLLEWFLAQKEGTVRGFANAVFSGFYTRSLADLILDIVSQHSVSGLRHLSAEPISKLVLLEKVRDACRLPIHIVPDESVRMDRSLDATMIRNECHIQVPSWDAMIDMLAGDLKKEGRL
jgi:dTDP-4-dehydrorhamnose reductase